MTELGETQSATELVPGDLATVRANVGAFRVRATSAEAVGDGLIDIDTGAWVGQSGDAFREKFSYEPNKWFDAASSLQTAADALSTYADVLEWAQKQAGEAIRLWNEAEGRTNQARQDHDQAIAQAAPGQEVPPFVDAGEPGRQAARDVLGSAREQVSNAGSQAASFLNNEAAAAPEKSSWLDDAGDFLKDVGADVVNTLASMGNAVIHHPGDVATAAAGIGLMLLSSGGEGLGVALDATGAGAVVGVPLNVVSAAGLATGATMTTAAGASLM
ncbi:putative T7SS-secreted protein [Actinoplanes sp. HUAS TT8]|uniref:putative T7SS-secreted protein n=1 Tax=Actinoplanes sp. HUAS TT8 TaxID=3447453 RepID=UPI003F528FF8